MYRRILAFTLLLLLQSGCTLMGTKVLNIKGNWTLFAVDGQTVAMAGTKKQAGFTLNLGDNGVASGRVACNSWRASYQQEAATLMLSQAMSTKAYCLLQSDELKAIERAFPSALNQGQIETAGDKELIILSRDGKRWVFHR